MYRHALKEVNDFHADYKRDVGKGGFYIVEDEDMDGRFHATMLGPSDSPHHGGVYMMTVTTTQNYPFMSPNVVFNNVPYHPNIASNGQVGLNYFSEWRTDKTIIEGLEIIYQMMADPGIGDKVMRPQAWWDWRYDAQTYQENVNKYKTK